MSFNVFIENVFAKVFPGILIYVNIQTKKNGFYEIVIGISALRADMIRAGISGEVIMKKLLRRSVALLMMLALILAATSTTFAAAKTKTVKKKTFSTSTSAINKKATKVKKGTTKLYIKKGQGYVKFKAPKTKTYKFTISKCTSKKRNVSGYFYIMKPDSHSPKYSFITQVKTKGGKTGTLWLSANGYKSTSSDTLTKPLSSRTGSIKLKKGQTVYLYISFLDVPTKAKLVIK